MTHIKSYYLNITKWDSFKKNHTLGLVMERSFTWNYRVICNLIILILVWPNYIEDDAQTSKDDASSLEVI